ncbi:Sulfotransferase domain-containing protein [Formosa sp. Hel1_31_208]|uniref:sulfotransferase family protein n=1 Tax=Formosa sp. Hel1_31_208 TaxID=1798225 RepID=UPI000879C4EA|nr:sulfotransferase [Formosa sp. Hel1_31_208]SDS68819.1 Sulfotransferase domain-containing protein [Formosa sp. Hel1_31_208]
MGTANQNNWTSKHPEYLPDFIIGGAMKSGTTSIHAILDAHPEVAIARDELGFFDIDSMLQHPDFNFYDAKHKVWLRQSMEQHPELLWDWYHSKFKDLKTTSNCVGEDSTSYLASRIAAKRISMQDKPIKLIFMLRHPTKRVISNYLHKLKSGRAIYSLEETLRYAPNSIIERSLYKEQLEFYYKHIPFDRIKIVLFEDFIQNKEASIKAICDFLNINFDAFDKTVFDTHSNKTKVPKYIGLQLFRNRLLKKTGNYRYSNFLPIQPSFQVRMPLWMRVTDKLHKKINPQSSKYTFEASKDSLRCLDDYFKTELEGIDDLVKKEVYSKWFKDE